MKKLSKTLIAGAFLGGLVVVVGCASANGGLSVNLNGMESETLEINTVYAITAEGVNAEEFLVDVTAPNGTKVSVNADNEFRLRYLGDYKIVLTAKNGDSEKREEVYITCVDTQKPIIVVNGGQTTFSYMETCILPSATVTDNDPTLDAQATAAVVSPSGKTVELYNNSFLVEETGVYQVTYTGEADNAGNIPDAVSFFLYGKSPDEVNCFDSEYSLDGLKVNSGNRNSYYLNTKEKQYIKSGESSLRFTVEKGDAWGGWPTLYLSNTFYRDMRMFEYITFTLFNPQDYDFTFYIEDYGFKVPANGSIDACFPVYDVIKSRSKNDITAMDSIMFVITAANIPSEQESFTYYLDEVKLIRYEDAFLKVENVAEIVMLGEETSVSEAILFGTSEHAKVETIVISPDGKEVEVSENGTFRALIEGEYKVVYSSVVNGKFVTADATIYVPGKNEYADFTKSEALQSIISIHTGNNTSVESDENGLKVICGKWEGAFAGWHGVNIQNKLGDLSPYEGMNITLYNPNEVSVTVTLKLISENKLLGISKEVFSASVVVAAGETITKTVAFRGLDGLANASYVSVSVGTTEGQYGSYETLPYYVKNIFLVPYDKADIEIEEEIQGIAAIGNRVRIPVGFVVGGSLEGDINVSVLQPDNTFLDFGNNTYFIPVMSGVYEVIYSAIVDGEEIARSFNVYVLGENTVADFDEEADWASIVSYNSGNATSYAYDKENGMCVTFGKFDGAFAGWQVFKVQNLLASDWTGYEKISLTLTNLSSVEIKPYIATYSPEIATYITIGAGETVTITIDITSGMTNVEYVGIGFAYNQSITAENAALVDEIEIRIHSVELLKKESLVITDFTDIEYTVNSGNATTVSVNEEGALVVDCGRALNSGTGFGGDQGITFSLEQFGDLSKYKTITVTIEHSTAGLAEGTERVSAQFFIKIYKPSTSTGPDIEAKGVFIVNGNTSELEIDISEVEWMHYGGIRITINTPASFDSSVTGNMQYKIVKLEFGS